jgi:hypothetical protein
MTLEPSLFHACELWRARAVRAEAVRDEFLTALKALVSDIEDYERTNNLAPNPGKPDCWQTVTTARATIAKAEGR